MFDVVIGNPPYNGKIKNSRKLWPKFVLKYIDIALEKMLFITPNKWIKEKALMLNNSEKVKIKLYERGNVYVDLNANKYFPGIGENIGWWICDINNDKNHTFTIKDNDKTKTLNYHEYEEMCDLWDTICKKVLLSNTPTYDMKAQNGITTKDLSTNSNGYLFYYSRKQFVEGNKYISEKFEDYPKLKVVLNRTAWSNNINKFNEYCFISKNIIAGEFASYILMDNETEANNFIKLMKSKLFALLLYNRPNNKHNAYMNDIFRYLKKKNKNNLSNVYHIPKLDLSKTWTDQELYEHFNLTQEEIDYIEERVN